jgi:hypothetical protein
METTKEIQKQLEDLKTGLETSVSEGMKANLQKAVAEMQAALASQNSEAIQKAIKENLTVINEGLKELGDWRKERTEKDAANQEALNGLLTQIKEINKNTKRSPILSLDEAISQKLAEDGVVEQLRGVRKGKSFMMDFAGMGPIAMATKLVGNMTVGANLTGDSQASYATGPAILPAQKINFRDLMRTVMSDTGLYVHYKESGGEGNVGEQTEGNAKDQLDFDFTEVKTVNKYVSGFTRFSKQMVKSLPFFQSTLPALLLRKFYNEENDYFYTTVAAAATGSGTTTESDAVKALIDLIADQRTANFNASYVLVDHLTMAKFQKRTYTTGNYQGSGGVVSMPDGSIRIANCPIIPASWVAADDVLIIDNDYLERIEVEGLRIEFFEQDGDNVTKNLITARIECYEEVNLMLPSSAILFDIADAS